METNTSNSNPSGQTPNGTDLTGQTPNPSGQTPSGTLQKTSLESLPLDIQEMIKSLRKEAETNRKELEAKAKAEQAEAQRRMQEQGEWQKLAEQHKAEAQSKEQELVPLKEEHEQLKGLVSQQIAALTKDWPKSVKDLIPGEDMPIVARYAQVQKLAALAQELQPRNSLPGNAPNPKPASGTAQQTQEQVENKLRATGIYGRF